jgi:exodeoxyribonuclease V alpha subunit
VVAALRADGVTTRPRRSSPPSSPARVLEHEPPDRTTTRTPIPASCPRARPALRTLSLARYGMAEEAVAENVARLAATAERIADPAAVRSVARGLTTRRSRPSRRSWAPASPADRRARDRQEPHGRRGRELLQSKGTRSRLAPPPAGRPKRLEELTDHPAVTVHRLLGAQGTSGGFARNEEWPLDADVVVVDEASMLDVELTAALLEACPDGTHLLLVGDPGAAALDRPGPRAGRPHRLRRRPGHRADHPLPAGEGGAIARLANAVRAGSCRRWTPPTARSSSSRRRQRGGGQAGGAAGHRLHPAGAGDRPATVQVVTPVHRGPAGHDRAEQGAQGQLNPGEGTVWGFDVGDRVVATANHLDLEPTGFANGEVGVVTGTGDGTLDVAFASGPVTVSGSAMSDLRHGWAITVHRAQGSEWPGVVVVLPPEAGGMLSRPLVYTALTRAQRHLSIVHASGAALARAVREVDVRPRRTRLAQLLAE